MSYCIDCEKPKKDNPSPRCPSCAGKRSQDKRRKTGHKKESRIFIRPRTISIYKY